MRFLQCAFLLAFLALGGCDSRPGLDGSGFSLRIQVETAEGRPVQGLDASIETLFIPPELQRSGDTFLLTTYPSPFREEGYVGVGVSSETQATIELLAVDSVVVRTLADTLLPSGAYVFPILGDGLPGGAYLLRAQVGERALHEWLLATDGPPEQTDRIQRALGPLGARGRATFRDRRIAPALYGYPASFVLINDVSTRTGRVSLSPDVEVVVTDGKRTERQRIELVNGPNEVLITW